MSINYRMEIITPKDYVGALIELSQQRRGDFVDMKYMTEARTTLVYDMPLAEVRLCFHLLWFQHGCPDAMGLLSTTSAQNVTAMRPGMFKLSSHCLALVHR